MNQFAKVNNEYNEVVKNYFTNLFEFSYVVLWLIPFMMVYKFITLNFQADLFSGAIQGTVLFIIMLTFTKEMYKRVSSKQFFYNIYSFVIYIFAIGFLSIVILDNNYNIANIFYAMLLFFISALLANKKVFFVELVLVILALVYILLSEDHIKAHYLSYLVEISFIIILGYMISRALIMSAEKMKNKSEAVANRLQTLRRYKAEAETEKFCTTQHLSTIQNELFELIQLIQSSTDDGLGKAQDKDFPREALSSYFTIIQQQGDRIIKLINNILDVAKLQAQQIKLNIQKIVLFNELSEIIKLSNMVLDSKLTTVNVIDPNNCLTEIKGDKRLISQMFTEMLTTLVKYTGKQETIDISFKTATLPNERGGNTNALALTFEGANLIIPENGFMDPVNKITDDISIDLTFTLCGNIVKLHNGRIWSEKNNDLHTNKIICVFPFEYE